MGGQHLASVGAPRRGLNPPGQQVTGALPLQVGMGAVLPSQPPLAPPCALSLGQGGGGAGKAGRQAGRRVLGTGPADRDRVGTTTPNTEPVAHQQTLPGPLPGEGANATTRDPDILPALHQRHSVLRPGHPRHCGALAASVYQVSRQGSCPSDTGDGDTASKPATCPSQPLAQPAPGGGRSLTPGMLSVSLGNGDLPPCLVTPRRGPRSGSSSPAPSSACLGLCPASRVPCPQPLPGASAEPGAVQPQGPSWKGPVSST